MKTYTIRFRTMDGNYHREVILADTPADAEIKFREAERGKVRWSKIWQIVRVTFTA